MSHLKLFNLVYYKYIYIHKKKKTVDRIVANVYRQINALHVTELSLLASLFAGGRVYHMNVSNAIN